MKAHRATNREIEVKLRVEQPDEMLRRIRKLGAKCDGRVFERNTLYDTPGGDFRHVGCLLRVRVQAPAPSKLVRGGRRGAVVTSKAPMPGASRARYKEKLERELPIRNPVSFQASLKRLGLRPAFRYEKYRSTFRLGGLHLCLDETPVGRFLELEGMPRVIDRAARKLGFGPKEYLRATYWDVYAADCRRRGVKPRNMAFPA
jgi:adenylate cyclase, class 2